MDTKLKLPSSEEFFKTVKDGKDFLTPWSILISYIIFISIFIFKEKIPIELFLFASCLLTSICVIGSLFLGLPFFIITGKQSKISHDLKVHVVPFLIFIFLFIPMVSRLSKYSFSKNNMRKNSTSYFLRIFLIFIIILILYTSVSDISKYKNIAEERNIFRPENIVIIYVLLICAFISSYKVYTNILHNV